MSTNCSREKRELARVMVRHGVKWLQKGTHEKNLSVLEFEKQARAVETELLQEKADNLERVKQYSGAEQIDTIIGKVKEQKLMEQQARQYHRSYGTR